MLNRHPARMYPPWFGAHGIHRLMLECVCFGGVFCRWTHCTQKQTMCTRSGTKDMQTKPYNYHLYPAITWKVAHVDCQAKSSTFCFFIHFSIVARYFARSWQETYHRRSFRDQHGQMDDGWCLGTMLSFWFSLETKLPKWLVTFHRFAYHPSDMERRIWKGPLLSLSKSQCKAWQRLLLLSALGAESSGAPLDSFHLQFW